MTAHVLPAPLVPEKDNGEIICLVLDDFGQLGRTYVETDEKKADFESVIGALMTGQYTAPVRVIAFNLTEGWVRDISMQIAIEVVERARLEQDDLPESTRTFVETHIGQDVTSL